MVTDVRESSIFYLMNIKRRIWRNRKKNKIRSDRLFIIRRVEV